MFPALFRFSKRIGFPLLLEFLVISYSGESADAAEKADPVFTGAKVYTVDEHRSWASAVGVSDGLIVYVGSDEGAQAWIDSNAKVVDLAGRTMLPGFQDAHIHIKMGGAQLEYLDLSSARSRQDILNMLKEYAEAHPEKESVVGVNFPLHVFPDANPRKEDVDAIVSGRPVYLIESEAHSG